MTVTRVFLTGFMGSGKTTVGQMLARALQWRFIDLDQYIEEQRGQSVSDIFSTHGETAFRQMEHEAVIEMTHLSRVIVSTGGGTPCFHGNMDLMNQSGLTIYLKLSADILKDRLMPARKTRPLIAEKSDSELLDFVRKKLEEREPCYEKAAVKADATTVGVAPYINIIEMYNQSNHPQT
jgi:shikimate kinase